MNFDTVLSNVESYMKCQLATEKFGINAESTTDYFLSVLKIHRK